MFMCLRNACAEREQATALNHFRFLTTHFAIFVLMLLRIRSIASTLKNVSLFTADQMYNLRKLFAGQRTNTALPMPNCGELAGFFHN